MKASIRYCLTGLLAIATLPACAQTRTPSAEQREALQERLRAADANGDGYIDRAEADASLPRVAKRFEQLDTDDDGRISREEFQAMASQFAQRRNGGR